MEETDARALLAMQLELHARLQAMRLVFGTVLYDWVNVQPDRLAYVDSLRRRTEERLEPSTPPRLRLHVEELLGHLESVRSSEAGPSEEI